METRKNQGRETMGLEQGWKKKKESRAIREERRKKNEFIFHPK